MTNNQPPRPNGVGRPGSGARPPPERSISPAPVAVRNPPITPDHTAVIDAEWSDDPIAVRAADEREELLRAQRAENARLKVELELERKSRVPELPSPQTDRERAKEWPPRSVPAPGYRPKLESSQEIHIHQHVERARGDSLPPRSARERAGEALRTPIAKAAGALLAAVLGGGGVSVIHDATKPAAPEKRAASLELGSKLKENQRNLAADLARNDRADREREEWSDEENQKIQQRLKRLEKKLRLQTDESLEPDEPPPAPPPPRKPDLPERL